MVGVEAVMPLRFRRQASTSALLLVAVMFVVGCSQEPGDTSSTGASRDHAAQMTSALPGATRPVPDEYQEGKKQFGAFCARCHGRAGVGTNAGPPLVHKIYEPSHHADSAFMRAAAQGVRAHHWGFGNMPKVTAATSDNVAAIILYVRWLQREAGIS